MGRTVTGQRRVAIVGAGMTGAIVARTLEAHGQSVFVLDKGRGPGGRCATHRDDPTAVDHGAQYFTVRDERLAGQLAEWTRAGVVAPWKAKFVEIRGGGVADAPRRDRWVGVPGMNRIASYLLEGLEARFNTTITSLTRQKSGWWLGDQQGAEWGPFPRVVVTLPAPQAAELLIGLSCRLARQVAEVQFEPCWAVTVVFARRVPLAFDAAKVRCDQALAWIARNSSKPGRPPVPPEAWVLHADNQWSAHHLEADSGQIVDLMTAEFAHLCRTLRISVPQIVRAEAWRWRYARPRAPLGESCLHDAEKGIVVCGDWLLDGKIEAACLSGLAAADLMQGVGHGP